MISAEEAKKLTEANMIDVTDKCLKYCEEEIKAACEKGKDFVYISKYYITDSATKQLKELGYKVELHISKGIWDDEYEISW